MAEPAPSATPLSGWAPGTRVEVRDRFVHGWAPGFVVESAEHAQYRLRRISDNAVLPALFREEDVRLA
jgi:hypothetical protein